MRIVGADGSHEPSAYSVYDLFDTALNYLDWKYNLWLKNYVNANASTSISSDSSWLLSSSTRKKWR